MIYGATIKRSGLGTVEAGNLTSCCPTMDDETIVIGAIDGPRFCGFVSCCWY